MWREEGIQYIYIYIIKREREVVGVHYRRSTLVEKGMDKTHNYPWSLSSWEKLIRYFENIQFALKCKYFGKEYRNNVKCYLYLGGKLDIYFFKVWVAFVISLNLKSGFCINFTKKYQVRFTI